MAEPDAGHFLGRGIIHPIDDRGARTRRATLNYSTRWRRIAASGYDVDALIRVICNSAAYGLSSIPEEANKDDARAARYTPRFPPRCCSTESVRCSKPRRSSGVLQATSRGYRAIDLPDEAVPSQFLDVFGRPARNSACECERAGRAALGQTLALIGALEMQDKLTSEKGTQAARG